MKIYKNIAKEEWQQITRRPVIDLREIEQKVQPVLDEVKQNGDEALRRLTQKFDGVQLASLEVSEEEKNNAGKLLDSGLKAAIGQAKDNIERFHSSQREESREIETMPGVRCWRRSVPIEKVGLYVPGGTAPLFSTVLMLGIPAQLAGFPEVIVCTPPQKDGTVHPAILYAAEIAGVKRVFKAGGAQAIAAMAYGTETVPRVFKIFGPGNQYVAAAKQLVNRQGVAIDLFAGPSEVLVLADHMANPLYVATDLLAQAEHGIDSHCLLVTTSEELLTNVQTAIGKLVAESPRQQILQKAISNFSLVLVPNIDEGVSFSNAYAPEHLIIATENPRRIGEDIQNAGSVFLGHLTPVSLGDYASGTNHTLPTNGSAIATSGVSLDSFLKKITFQEATKEGLEHLGPVVQQLALAEELPAHSQAVSVRLKQESNKR